ncbi:hypothetical protein [uncultured Aquitalea sp.]|uniref:hypothetical protein n=1 Tax=uncultured Aquitalea sp. TaxID=540272 RepID=UPI0025DDEFBA|nr:hypothetical protein [uncultured Aquitalea sp.]
MLLFWRLWVLVIVLLFGWALINYALTRNPLYLMRVKRLFRWTGGFGLLLTLFWLIARWLR